MTKTAEEFACDQCSWTGKSKSALTQHQNKQHSDKGLDEIRKQFGDSAPRPGGAINGSRPLQARPSGIPSIDYAIGIGGVPQGALVEVFGDPKVGKSFTALTFSAHAQEQGLRAGYLDVEKAPGQETFMKLVPGLNMDTLEYGRPTHGEDAMEQSKQFIRTGMFATWTIDSLHACIPEAVIDLPIGSPQARAALARLLSEALPILEHVTAGTSTTLILVNHKKVKPNANRFEKPWYTPGGSAPEYYSSVRLHVWQSGTFTDKKSKVRIGHTVKVKVEASKVAAPFNTASYDIYYREGTRTDGREVLPGVDIGSSWLSVLVEEGKLAKSTSGTYYHTDSGEKLGDANDLIIAFDEDGDHPLIQEAKAIVYPERYAHK